MSSYKMLYVASALVLGWVGVAAVCFSSIATVPGNLAIISHQRTAPAPAPQLQAPAMSVASGEKAAPSTATP